MYFQSRKDLWLSFIFWIIILLLCIDGIFNIQWGIFLVPDILNTYFLRLAFLLLAGIFLLWIWFKTGYLINQSNLTIYFGPIKKKINIHEITSIRTVKDPFIAPALSIDRIEIHYGNYRTIRISPKNKLTFTQQLQKISASIKIE